MPNFNTWQAGISGMGLWGLPVGSYPGGAVLFVNSATGVNNRGRLKFPGSGAIAGSTGSANQGPVGDPYLPLASIAYALAQCKSGRNDCIFVQPGHQELPTTNLLINVNDVNIIGMQAGNSSDRPVIQPQATGVTVSITGNNVVIANIIFDGTFVDDITAVVTLNAIGVSMYNVHWKLTTSTHGAALGMSITGGSGLLMEYCSCNATTATTGTTPTNFILTATASHDHFTCRNCNFRGTFSAAIIADSSAAPFTNIEFGPNNLLYQGTSGIVCLTFQSTGTTGTVFNNVLYDNDTSKPTWIGGTNTANLILSQNYGYYAKTGGPFSALLTPAVGT
jgi:hypothetical protein